MSKTGTRAPNGAGALDRAKLHSELQGDCWIWKGYVWQGNPMMNSSANTPMLLRPTLLEELHGERPEWAKAATTTCGNRLCVNPDHVKWETMDEYRRRCRAKAAAKMTVEQVEESWKRKQAGESVTSLDEEYGISRIGLYRQWDRWVLDRPIRRYDRPGR